jgi:hypothetical protein
MTERLTALIVWEGDSLPARNQLRLLREENTKTTRSIQSDSKKTGAAFDDMGKHAGRLHGLVSGLGGVLGVGGVLAFGLKDSIQGALRFQAATTQVSNQLANLGLKGDAARKAVAGIATQSEALSTKGGGNTEEMIAGFGQLLGVTHSVTKAQQAQNAAVGLAKLSQQSYGSALQLILSAEAGRVKGIQKYIGIVTPVKTAEQQLADATKRHNYELTVQSKLMGHRGALTIAQERMYGGVTAQQRAAAVSADKLATAQQIIGQVATAGAHAHESETQKITDAQHAFQNLSRQLGTSVLPLVTKMATGLADVAGWLGKNKTVLYGLFGTITALTIAVGIHKGALELLKLKEDAARLAVWAFGNKTATAGAQTATMGDESKIAGLQTATMGDEALAAGDKTAAGSLAGGVPIAGGAAAGAEGAAATGLLSKIGAGAKLGLRGGLAGLVGVTGASTLRSLTGIGRHHGKSSGLGELIGTGAGGVLGGLLGSILPGPGTVVGAGIGAGVGNLAGGFLGTLLHHSGGVIARFANGGYVGDSVPAMLTPGEGVLTTAAMSRLGAAGLARLNSGGSGAQNITIQPGLVQLRLDSRVIAQGVVQYTLQRGARGPSSYSGGSLSTGNLQGTP